MLNFEFWMLDVEFLILISILSLIQNPEFKIQN